MLLFYADGRLGNQLFQYSFLRQLAKPDERVWCANMDALFDSFELPASGFTHFGGRLANWLARRIVAPFLLLPLARMGLIGELGQVVDEQGRYLPSLRHKRGLLPVNYVLPHYFQSEQMFSLASAAASLKLKQPHMAAAQRILSSLPSDRAPVFVHVRLGDYKQIQFVGELGIQLPASYFQAAAERIRREIPNPVFLVLSDSPEEADRLLTGLEPRVLSRAPMAVDLALMRLCSGGIIANSSFSWWGAALMARPRAVVAPLYWYGWKKRFDSHPGIQPSFATAIDPLGEAPPCAG